jgi:hypothetical protein
VPPALRALLDRLLAKRPDDRIQSAAIVREALEVLRTGAAHSGLSGASTATARGVAASRPLTVTGVPGSTNAEANDAFALAMHFIRVQNLRTLQAVEARRRR